LWMECLIFLAAPGETPQPCKRRRVQPRHVRLQQYRRAISRILPRFSGLDIPAFRLFKCSGAIFLENSPVVVLMAAA